MRFEPRRQQARSGGKPMTKVVSYIHAIIRFFRSGELPDARYRAKSLIPRQIFFQIPEEAQLPVVEVLQIGRYKEWCEKLS